MIVHQLNNVILKTLHFEKKKPFVSKYFSVLENRKENEAHQTLPNNVPKGRQQYPNPFIVVPIFINVALKKGCPCL